MAASMLRNSICVNTESLRYFLGLNKRLHILNTPHRLASEDTSKSKSTPLKKPNTPVGKWDKSEKHPHMEQEPLEAFPNDVNPVTGEKGGPRGPEPTRYGDWERKGRCIDF
ncbi:succinate dehydrogenase assembly factor 4, mitochondrial-like [Anneissia japonica]|uniref:succinate dehydrogenase assembly factor 4, mitochondrial-like n=1 Tax=Anneissia japonica TaxID=1529436 RepID=UPI001425748B|nr:succinate dehydrogenase assembly factor 4, mitochondrial-like [Anneissia japonica]